MRSGNGVSGSGGGGVLVGGIIGGVVGVEEHYWRGVRWRLLLVGHQVRPIYGQHVRGREGFIGRPPTILDT